MRRRYARVAIGATVVVVLVVGALAAFAPSRAQQIDYGKVVANVSLLNVRNGPGDYFLVVGVVPGGTEMPVTGITADGGWFQVESPFGKAFVFAEFVVYRGSAPGLIPIVPPSGVSSTDAPVVTVMVPMLNVRSQPVLGSNVIGVVPQSFVMSVTGQSAETGWYQVISPFGTGWVANALVTVSGDASSIPLVDPEGNIIKADDKKAKTTTTTPTFTSYTTYTTTTTTEPAKKTKKGKAPEGKVTVIATRMNVRGGPGTNYPIVGLVTQGTELAVTGVFPNALWWEVESPQGTGVKVYVSGSYVVFSGNLEKVPLLSFGDFAPSTTTVTVLPATTITTDGVGGGGDGTIVTTTDTGTVVLIPGDPHVIVNTSVLNVHNGPGAAWPVIGTVAGGTRLEVTGQFPDAKWWEVHSPFGGGRAYVSGDFVVFRGSSFFVPLLSYSAFPTSPSVGVPVTTTTTTTTTTTGTVIPAGTAHVVVNTPVMNVRSGPGGQFVPLGTVPGGTEMIVTGQFPDAKWWEVESPFGEGRAYVSGDFVVFRGSATFVPLLSYSSFPGY